MTESTVGTPILRMRDISKSFPGVRALDGVDLEVVAGEVHCLLGQNGAGKSTLIKVLAGAHRPDAGTIEIRGERVELATPIAALRAGVATMYQELDLVPWLSVAENIFLGSELAMAGVTNRRTTRRRARDRRGGRPARCRAIPSSARRQRGRSAGSRRPGRRPLHQPR